MRILPNVAVLVLLATPALAQQAQPSPQALISALHQQVLSEADQITLADARLLDAQQQIAVLQQKLADADKPKSK